MGVPISEVGYTIATTRRETTKVHKNVWWHWGGRGDQVQVAYGINSYEKFALLIWVETDCRKVINIFVRKVLRKIYGPVLVNGQ